MLNRFHLYLLIEMSEEDLGDSDYDSISDISSLGSFADRYAAKATQEVAEKKNPRKSKRKTTVEGDPGLAGEDGTKKKRKSTVRKKKKDGAEGEGEADSAEAREQRKTARKSKKLRNTVLKGLNDRVLGLDDDLNDLDISASSPAKPPVFPAAVPAVANPVIAAPAIAAPVFVEPTVVTPVTVPIIAGALPMEVAPVSPSPMPAVRAPSPKVNLMSSSRVSPLPTESAPSPRQYIATPREAEPVSIAMVPTAVVKSESTPSSSRKSSGNYDISEPTDSARGSFNSSGMNAPTSAIAERRRAAAAARATKLANQSNKEREDVVSFSAYETTPEVTAKTRKSLDKMSKITDEPAQQSSPRKSTRSARHKGHGSDSSDVASLDSYMSSDDSEQRARRRKKEKQRQKEREREEREAKDNKEKERRAKERERDLEKEAEREREREKAAEREREAEREKERERERAEEVKRTEKESRKRDKKAQKEIEAAEEVEDALSTPDVTPPAAESGIRLPPAPLTHSLSFGRKGARDQGFCRLIKSTTYLNAIKIAHGETPKVLCASADSTVQIYNITDGAPLPSLVGHTDRVISLAVSNPFMYADKASGGKATLKTLVASGSRDEQLRIWDMDTAKCLHSIHAHKSPIWAVAIAVRPNGDVIVVSTSGDGSMRSWNGKTGKKMSNFKGHTDKILSVYIMNPLSDNPLVLSGGADKKIRVWELLTGAHIRMLEGHDDEINSVVAGSFSGISSLIPISNINEDENHAAVAGLDANKSTVIVSASKDLTVRVWDFKSGHLLFELLGHSACVYEVALMRAKESPLSKGKNVIPPGTPIIVSCSEDATVKLWNLVTGKLIKSLKWHSVSVRGIDVASVLAQSSSDPNSGISLIASCGWDKTIQFHELGEALYAQKDGFCSIS